MNRYEEIETSIRYLRKMMLENKIKYYHYLSAGDDVAADRTDGKITGIMIGMGELYNLLSPKDQDESNIYDDKENELQAELNRVYLEFLEEG